MRTEGYNLQAMPGSDPTQLDAAQAESTRGRLKVFLGYASGVGKSFRMFDEARRRKERGQDVVVGALQPHVPPEIEPILSSLEIVPTIDVEGVPVIDVLAILRRHPQVCLVDGLAYDNPWSRKAYRWQGQRSSPAWAWQHCYAKQSGMRVLERSRRSGCPFFPKFNLRCFAASLHPAEHRR